MVAMQLTLYSAIGLTDNVNYSNVGIARGLLIGNSPQIWDYDYTPMRDSSMQLTLKDSLTM